MLAEVPAPDKAKPFTGPVLKIDLTIVWQPPSLNGNREGRIQVAIEGMPASMGGTGEMVHVGTITEVDFNAEFSINLPLIGRGLEVAAAPYVRRVIDTQQAVGNDYLAGGALSALDAAGVPVPQQMSVASFNDNDFAPYLHPPLTTVRVPIRAIGEQSAAQLVAQLKGETPTRVVLLPVELIIRNSTAAAPAVPSRRPRGAPR